MLYFPLVVTLMILLLLLSMIVLAIIQVGIIHYAFGKIGVPAPFMFLLLMASFLGSLINIPVARIPQEQVLSGGTVRYFGLLYQVPPTRVRTHTLIAVNVGGALVPAGLSAYLLTRIGQLDTIFVGVLLITAITYYLARPVPGVGIAVPVLVAPVTAAVYALLLAPVAQAGVAYIAGTLGTLLGADILNLPRIRDLRAPVVSIGGAGTFDGIFLTGIIAVLLASM